MHYVNVAPYLGLAQREIKAQQIFVGNGHFGFTTPFFATENTFADNGIDNSRVSMHYYKVGHMIYIESEFLALLVKDFRVFYQSQ